MKIARSPAANKRQAHSRLSRLLALPLAVFLILGGPGLASAAFSAKVSAQLGVGTYTIPAPGPYTATATCNTGPRSIKITAVSFPAVPKATSYVATVTAPNGTSSATVVSPSGFSITKGSTTGGTYSIRLNAKIGSWIGQDLIKDFNCA